MAIVVKYVVEHKGVEKLVTTDKKEADKYDKMLEVADNLASYISAKGITLEPETLEELSVTLARSKDAVAKILKGGSADAALEAESASVVDLKKKKA